ncbi:hypothetical protein A2159_01705 [Candidatus Woesebacteria bacterium RBG_13_34_9]|uniref:Type II secretion system protein GspG C-terminal domain-containing protein n=1 Tax=Candidatus Woesebacteria bacterium RBG_13_34_9 TaxID=1802477 RepID=A0A1F7X360_9BACT|nr:MAG: hypothetical protein A2159_01705 [Candidatus Woesebacteria bacterium RBG_13_34_9]
MKPFTKTEALVLIIIFFVVFAFTFQGLLVSKRKARDAQRRSDLGMINDALEDFGEDFGFYPPSEDGKIKACATDNLKTTIEEMKKENIFDRNKYFDALTSCEWGKDSLKDLVRGGTVYLEVIPSDQSGNNGINYLYISDTKYYQLYSYLEGGVGETGYDKGIVKRNLLCGRNICSFGKAIHETPLDVSIEEYEKLQNEKLIQSQTKK